MATSAVAQVLREIRAFLRPQYVVSIVILALVLGFLDVPVFEALVDGIVKLAQSGVGGFSR